VSWKCNGGDNDVVRRIFFYFFFWGGGGWGWCVEEGIRSLILLTFFFV
jgi:hypothetical protein